MPNNPDAFRQLPGVGRYILGAVLSQAFDRQLPIVEANSTRVLCRLFGQMGEPSSTPVRNWLWDAAQAILPIRRVGDFNQAIMELGALVCTPKSPDCSRCPLRSVCFARNAQLQETIPVKGKRSATVEVRESCVVFRHGTRVLLAQRPARGRWANMWEFPRVVLNRRESAIAGARRLMASLGLAVRSVIELMTIRYSVAQSRMTMRCLEAQVPVAIFRSDYYQEGRWVKPLELMRYPVSSPQRRLAEAVQQSMNRRQI